MREKENKGLQHDEFFRKVFSKLNNLLDLLRSALTEEEFNEIEVNSIKLTQDSFITDELKGLQSDLIIDVKIRDKTKKIAILVEHKANYDKFTLLQMLKYLVSYWDKEKSDKAKALTPITPILFFHGKSDWNKENDLTMCFDDELGKKYAGYIPNFDYILFDLNQVDDDELEGNIEFKCAIKIMKNIHKNVLPALMGAVKLIEDFIKDKALGNLKDFVILMLRYLSKSNKVKAKDIDEVIEKIKSSELKEAFMTLEKELELRGEKKGIQEGKKQIAKKLKQKGMSIKEITEITGLDKKQIEEL